VRAEGVRPDRLRRVPRDGDRVKKLLGFLGATAASYIGWYLGEVVGGGIMTSFILSTIAGGFGLYYGVKYAKRYE
jgi:hypothetical protein